MKLRLNRNPINRSRSNTIIIRERITCTSFRIRYNKIKSLTRFKLLFHDDLVPEITDRDERSVADFDRIEAYRASKFETNGHNSI